MKKSILLLAVLLLISVNIYAAGDLTVQGVINAKDIVVENTADGIIIKNDDAEAITFENLDGAMQLKMTNATDSSPVVFEMKSDQVPTTGHFDVIPGGLFDYWLFADSSPNANRAFKVCGYPSAASSTQCVSFRIEGANNDLNLTTEGAGSDILLMPQANVGIGITSPIYPLEMASGAHVTSGGVWTDASSREYKENISRLTSDEAVQTLNELDPVKFNYKADKEESYVGFIAEDVPEMVAMKDRKGLSPMDIVAVLTKVTQEQQKTISELREEVKELKREVKLKGSLASVVK